MADINPKSKSLRAADTIVFFSADVISFSLALLFLLSFMFLFPHFIKNKAPTAASNGKGIPKGAFNGSATVVAALTGNCLNAPP